MATSKKNTLPAKPHSRALPAEQVKEAMRNDEAYRMRMGGATFGEIAKALDIEGGWIEAYQIVASIYGSLVADLDVPAIRAREAGRLMDIRSGIEPDVRRGDAKMIEADLKMTAQIAELLGLSEKAQPSGGGGGAPQVQINISPPWERPGPAPDVIEGEAVEEY